jgi:hypothetical protein
MSNYLRRSKVKVIGRVKNLMRVDLSYLKVEMVSLGSSGHSDQRDGFTLRNGVSHPDIYKAAMTIIGTESVRVVYNNKVSVTAAPSGEGDYAACTRINSRSVRRAEIDTGMPAIAAVPPAQFGNSGDVARYRPDEVSVGRNFIRYSAAVRRRSCTYRYNACYRG